MSAVLRELRYGSHPLPVHRAARCAVLGAGNGGLALAGLLARKGHAVALWNRSAERIVAVAQRGGVELEFDGSATFAPLALATSRIADAVADAAVILVAVPATGHADIARACAPHLRNGHAVLLLPGRTGGALEFRRVLRSAGCRARVLLGEANTFPIAARRLGPTSAHVFGTKAELQIAALTADRTRELVRACRPILPMTSAAASVLHTGLANVGAILHPVITLLNADRIRRGERFDFYSDGVTPRVAAMLEAADAERLRIARAYGVATSPLPSWVAAAYGHHADTVLDAVAGNPAYRGITAPTTLAHRYLLEEVPTGLIPLLELGQAAGLELPVLRGLVIRARLELGGERWPCPRTLAALGLEGLAPRDIRTAVEGGAAPVRAVPAAGFAAGFSLVPQA
jgi:opine dehydrogenase